MNEGKKYANSVASGSSEVAGVKKERWTQPLAIILLHKM